MTDKLDLPTDNLSKPQAGQGTPARVGGVEPEQEEVEDGSGSVLDVPNMGEFSAEAARPTPLDDLAESSRGKRLDD